MDRGLCPVLRTRPGFSPPHLPALYLSIRGIPVRRPTLLQRYSNTPDTDRKDTKFKITHPFHPLYNQEFDLIVCRHNWGEYRVYFHDSNQLLISVPASWTSIATEDPFVKIAAGRSRFRSEDLLRLCNLIEDLEQRINKKEDADDNYV